MKILFLLLLIIHGLLHLIGFFHEFGFARIDALSNYHLPGIFSSRFTGMSWLITSLLFLFSAYGFSSQKFGWLWIVWITLFLSQILIVIYWPFAVYGTLVNAVIFLVSLVHWGEKKFNSRVQQETQELLSIKVSPGIPRQITDLPAPVQRWLQHSGVLHKEPIFSVSLRQEGQMRMKPGSTKWAHCVAEQVTSTELPSFVWKVKMLMFSIIPVIGRDKCIRGKAAIEMRLLSWFKIVDDQGPKLDSGALQRWLAEMCWYPSAALNPFIKWEPVDDHRSKAILDLNGISCSVIFEFNEDGDVAGCQADRYMKTNENATLLNWNVRSLEFDTMDGVRMPVRSEVTWKLPEGDFTWYRLHILKLQYHKKILAE